MAYSASDAMGNLKSETEATASRVGQEFRRAKDEIAQTAASAREDLSDDLRRLNEDVAKLKDTVTQLTKSVAAQVGSAAGDIGAEIASSAKDQASSVVTEFEKMARENPMAVVAGALCLGLVLGLMR